MGEIGRKGSINLFIAFVEDFKERLLFNLPLQKEERRRGKEILSYKKREEYLLSRYLLRSLLGKLLDTPAEEIPILRSRWGKPYIPETVFSLKPHLHFSISHSSGIMILSFSFGHRTGVDLEKARPLRTLEDLVSYVLPEKEQYLWEELSPDKKVGFFLQRWTRREAVIKCLGLSAAEDIQSFLIREAPCTYAEGGEVSWHTELKEISLHGRDIHLNLSSYSALAWEGEIRKISVFRAIPGPGTNDQPHTTLLREIVQE